MSQSPKIVKPPEPKMVPKEPSFDLLGGFESSETMGGKTMPDILSKTNHFEFIECEKKCFFPLDNGKNQSNIDDIFNAFGAAPQKPPDSSLNLNFNAFSNNMNTSSSALNTSGIFDPFGLGTGFSDNATLPLKPLNPSQQASKETSPQQSSPQPTQV